MGGGGGGLRGWSARLVCPGGQWQWPAIHRPCKPSSTSDHPRHPAGVAPSVKGHQVGPPPKDIPHRPPYPVPVQRPCLRHPTLITGAVALVLRLTHGFLSPSPLPVLDQARFLSQAAAIRAGQGAGPGPYATSPLYPYFIALFGEGTRWVQLLLGAGTVALAAQIATSRLGRRAGWTAGLLLAAFGPALHYEGQLLVAGPLAFFLTLALAFAPDEPGPRPQLRGAAAGVALALASALRPTALAPAIALLAATLLRRQTRAAGALATALVLGILPFTLRNAAVAGEPILLTSGGGFNLWVGNHPGAPGVFDAPPGYDFALDPAGIELARRESGEELSAAEASAWWRARALAGMSPGLFLRKLILSFHPEEIPQLGPDDFRPARRDRWWLRWPIDARWILLLALLAPLAAWKRHQTLLAPLLMALAYGATLLLFFVSGRFRFPLLPLAAILAGATLPCLPRRPPLTLTATVLAILSLWLYRPTGPYSLGQASTRGARARALAHEGHYLEAAETFRSLLDADPAYARGALDLARLLLGPLLGSDPDSKRAAWSEAAQVLERALERGPGPGEAWFYLGVARLNLGRRAEAAQALEQALMMSRGDEPWLSEAQRALEAAGH